MKTNYSFLQIIMISCIRPKWEGGAYEGDEHERLEVLRLAHELGADYIDLELKVVFEILFTNRNRFLNFFTIVI